MCAVLANQRREVLLLFAAACRSAAGAPQLLALPDLETLGTMRLEELRIFFRQLSIPFMAADALFLRLMENVRLKRDVEASLWVIVNMIDSLEDPEVLFDQLQLNVLMTTALGYP